MERMRRMRGRGPACGGSSKQRQRGRARQGQHQGQRQRQQHLGCLCHSLAWQRLIMHKLQGLMAQQQGMVQQLLQGTCMPRTAMVHLP